VVWKLGQKSEYKSSENQASNEGKWENFGRKVLSNRPSNAALCSLESSCLGSCSGPGPDGLQLSCTLGHLLLLPALES